MSLNIERLKVKALKDGLSAYLVGRSYYSQENNCKQDYKESFKWYKFGYEKLKDPRCQYGFAMFYFDDGGGANQKMLLKKTTFLQINFSPTHCQNCKNWQMAGTCIQISFWAHISTMDWVA